MREKFWFASEIEQMFLEENFIVYLQKQYNSFLGYIQPISGNAGVPGTIRARHSG
jgi:hypothetical protein